MTTNETPDDDEQLKSVAYYALQIALTAKAELTALRTILVRRRIAILRDEFEREVAFAIREELDEMGSKHPSLAAMTLGVYADYPQNPRDQALSEEPDDLSRGEISAE